MSTDHVFTAVISNAPFGPPLCLIIDAILNVLAEVGEVMERIEANVTLRWSWLVQRVIPQDDKILLVASARVSEKPARLWTPSH